MASEEKPGRGFTVIDRRAGREEGEEEGRGKAPADAPAPPPGADGPAPSELPRIDFATFALSLGTSGLYHLGLVGDPQTGKPAQKPDLALARQTIDTLEMLQEKTKGNLGDEEAHLLESLLYELRMGFVQVSGSTA